MKKQLSQSEMLSRRLFDWQVVLRMDSPTYGFSAHRTVKDAQTGYHQILSEDDARYTLHYRGVFHIKTLVGQNMYSPRTIIRIDVSDARYPFKQPTAFVVEAGESRVPWSPHFARGVPVCTGSIWRKDGTVTLGHYIIHVAKLLNWDEELADHDRWYNPRAVEWWRENLNRPLNPDIRYPVLPVDLLYGDVSAPEGGGFRPSSSHPSPQEGGFRKIA